MVCYDHNVIKHDKKIFQKKYSERQIMKNYLPQIL